MHRDTVEEKMSRHRTRSVSGVEYEYVKASTLITSPESALGSGSDIFPCIMQRSGFPELPGCMSRTCQAHEVEGFVKGN